MGKQKQKSNGRFQSKVTWAQAVRDILVKAMTTGQLVPISIFVIILLTVYRIPEADLSLHINKILDGFIDHSLVGWGFFVVAIIFWVGHAAMMRRMFSAEVGRIGKEKTLHQQARTSQPLGTSDK
ncbi:hypothetical protein [Xenorhabdus sp. KK7.4]|uniref:hypothetical protein n=1 Tax=Xenorhabdus sp. KK7.4 TaxID=1851572 RepID=UPI000C041C69|nr:hypothetical protein [Xenorhabdus sp. KK7.4]PHM50976.1 hypothetical protein Xekk_04138 [Xenorhabdus sp. KK7.4]